MSTETITRDVVLDLLPAVRGGTASADSRRIVEGFLADDPEFAARAATIPFPSAELEMEALRRTHRRLGIDRWAFGLAIFFTALPLSFKVVDGQFSFIFADQMGLATFALMLAASCWFVYFRHRTMV